MALRDDLARVARAAAEHAVRDARRRVGPARVEAAVVPRDPDAAGRIGVSGGEREEAKPAGGPGLDLRDERGQLLDLEAQGARPAALRRVVRLRSAVVAGAGLVGGIVAGVVLSRLVVDLVAVTANARAVELPLELALDWGVLALAVGACGLLASVLVVAATRRA